MALIPPDFQHCQCFITPSYSPFSLGPRPRPKQCNVLPVWLAVETKPGDDGQHGAMTLCNDCAKVMLDDAAIRGRVQLQPIIRN